MTAPLKTLGDAIQELIARVEDLVDAVENLIVDVTGVPVPPFVPVDQEGR